jgi:anti-sigma regulatory factor (Ser/Thr protein kinase)
VGVEQSTGVREAEFPLTPSLVELQISRHYLTTFLADAGVDPQLASDVKVVASELVYNAIQHAGTAISLTVRLEPPGALVRVTDRRPDRTPVLVRGEELTGLALLERLCTAWGCDVDREVKHVWAVVAGPT